MTDTTTETKWQTRYRHDADEIRHIADRLDACRSVEAMNNPKAFADEYVYVANKLAALAEELWSAVTATWDGDEWPNG
jgi:hypothetical protein